MLVLNWDIQDRYVELMTFEMEVFNIKDTKAYKLLEEEKVPVVKKKLVGPEVLELIKIYMEEKEKSKTVKGLLTVLSSKFKLQHYRIIISLQYHNLHRKDNSSTQVWMGRL